MKRFFAYLKALFCSHEFQTIYVYDADTVKAYCSKCGNKYVINSRYKWKFKLDDISERDYEELRKRIAEFQKDYKEEDKPE